MDIYSITFNGRVSVGPEGSGFIGPVLTIDSSQERKGILCHKLE